MNHMNTRDVLDDMDRVELLETLPRLPDWQGRLPTESLRQYGQRALTFLFACALVDMLDVDALEQAFQCSTIAQSAPALSDVARARLHGVRTRILLLLDSKRKGQSVALPCATPNDKPNLGPMAPLHDRPLVQPPSGQKVEIGF